MHVHFSTRIGCWSEPSKLLIGHNPGASLLLMQLIGLEESMISLGNLTIATTVSMGKGGERSLGGFTAKTAATGCENSSWNVPIAC